MDITSLVLVITSENCKVMLHVSTYLLLFTIKVHAYPVEGLYLNLTTCTICFKMHHFLGSVAPPAISVI